MAADELLKVEVAVSAAAAEAVTGSADTGAQEDTGGRGGQRGWQDRDTGLTEAGCLPNTGTGTEEALRG